MTNKINIQNIESLQQEAKQLLKNLIAREQARPKGGFPKVINFPSSSASKKFASLTIS